MFFTVYLTTNKITNTKYIGKHITNNLDDSYLGSGMLLIKAINKYGSENFEKEILYVFDNEKEMNEKEKELITEDIVKSSEYYNIALGGQGGNIVLFKENINYEKICEKMSIVQQKNREKSSERAKRQHINKEIGMYGKSQSDYQKKRVSEVMKNKKVSRETIEKQKKSYRETVDHPDYVNPNKGRKQPLERVLKMKDTLSKLMSGNNNPMFGKNHSENTKIKISMSAKNRQKKECKYCGKFFSPSTHSRWHNDNCKEKIL